MNSYLSAANYHLPKQGAVQPYVSKKLALFVDYKELWLGVNAHGFLSGGPVTAHINQDPTIVSVGVRFHLSSGRRTRLLTSPGTSSGSLNNGRGALLRSKHINEILKNLECSKQQVMKLCEHRAFAKQQTSQEQEMQITPVAK